MQRSKVCKLRPERIYEFPWIEWILLFLVPHVSNEMGIRTSHFARSVVGTFAEKPIRECWNMCQALYSRIEVARVSNVEQPS